MSCSQNPITHTVPVGDFTLLYTGMCHNLGDIPSFYLFFDRYLHSNNLHELPDGKVTLFIVDTIFLCKLTGIKGLGEFNISSNKTLVKH